MTLLEDRTLIALDTETTGMHPDRGARLVEVARVTIENGATAGTWSSLLRPGVPIPPDAVRVHGITDAMVAGAPEPAAIAGPLRAACGDHALVFHNAGFDLPFLQVMFREAGEAPLGNPVVDTLGLARGLFGTGNNSLGAVAARLEIAPEPAHRALGDALTTAHVFLALAKRWEAERKIGTLAELAAASQDVVRRTGRR